MDHDQIQKDILDSIINISSDIVKLEAHEQKTIISKIKKMEKDLLNSLRDIDPTASKTQAKRLERTKEAIAQSKIITETYYKEIKNYHQGQLTEIAKFNNVHIANEINSIMGVKTFKTLMTTNQIKTLVNDEIIMGEKLNEFWSRQSSDVVRRYRNELQLGILSNDTFNQLERRIRGTRETGFRDGIMQVPNNQARTYIRTSIQDVANSARMQTYQDNSDVLEGIEWIATLDLRTSVICIGLDGKKWTLPDYKPIKHSYAYPGPIGHPNCRSTQLPVIKGIDNSGGTRASMIGQVSEKIKYEDWLKNPPKRMLEEAGRLEGMGRAMTTEEFQNMKLGVWKAEQFRRGKVDIRDLISPRTKDGTPIVYTIDELKKKYNLTDINKNVIIKDIEKEVRKFSLNGIEKEFQNEIKEQLNKIYEKFPINIESFKIKTENSSSYSGLCGRGVFYSKHKNIAIMKYDRKLILNKKVFKDAITAEETAKISAELRGLDWHDKYKTIWHEYGHAIDHIYKNKNYFEYEKEALNLFGYEGIKVERSFENFKDFNLKMRKLNDLNRKLITANLSDEITKTMLEETGLTKVDFWKNVKKEYGSYAATSKEEFLAEAFADMNLCKKEKTDFKKSFEKIFKKLTSEEFRWNL